jgi:hypothetical protein
MDTKILVEQRTASFFSMFVWNIRPHSTIVMTTIVWIFKTPLISQISFYCNRYYASAQALSKHWDLRGEVPCKFFRTAAVGLMIFYCTWINSKRSNLTLISIVSGWSTDPHLLQLVMVDDVLVSWAALGKRIQLVHMVHIAPQVCQLHRDIEV